MKRVSLIICATALFLNDAPAAENPHPRLLITEKDWAEFKSRSKRDEITKNMTEGVIRSADRNLEKESTKRVQVGRRMLGSSRQAIGRILDYSTAWRFTGKDKYLTACKAELLSASTFEDWNPTHLLDTAEMMTAVAIGYDWIYSELSENERSTIENALVEKGIKPTLAQPQTLARNNNWNQVCLGGLTLAAIAVENRFPELTEKSLQVVNANLIHGLKHGYSSDGAYAEGSGYWQYGTIYSILTAEALRKTGRDASTILEHPGFLASANFKKQSYGTSMTSFNYGDNNVSNINRSAAISWMIRETRNRNFYDFVLPAYQNKKIRDGDRFAVLSAFWFPKEKNTILSKEKLFYKGSGVSPIVIFRTGFEKKDLFLGIKGGAANVNHGHMDAGSFVIDWEGQRWATDLGRQDYHELESQGIYLFGKKQNSQRWTVFRTNNFAHNTLTKNDELHRVNGKAPITLAGDPNNPTAFVSLTEPLGLKGESKASREFEFDRSSKVIQITDHIKSDSSDEFTWKWMTAAKVTNRADGFGLELGGHKAKLKISSNHLIEMKSQPAKGPRKHDGELNGITQISVKVKGDPKTISTIKAIFQPQK